MDAFAGPVKSDMEDKAEENAGPGGDAEGLRRASAPRALVPGANDSVHDDGAVSAAAADAAAPSSTGPRLLLRARLDSWVGASAKRQRNVYA